MIYPVLSHFDFAAEFTVKNLIQCTTGGGVHHFMKLFHKIPIIFQRFLLDKHMNYIWQSGNLAIKQIEV